MLTPILQRMRHAGAFITTAESLLFQLLVDASHPQFKAVQALVKTQVELGPLAVVPPAATQ